MFNTIKILNDYPRNKYFDRKSTSEVETAKELINEYFVLAIDSLDAWKAKMGKEYVWY